MELKGTGASPGIAIGKAHVMRKLTVAINGTLLQGAGSINDELKKFDTAVATSVSEIETLKSTLELSGNQDGVDILDVQIELLTDPQLKQDVIAKIQSGKYASDALVEVVHAFVMTFRNMDDEYMRARSADIQDIGNRILRHLTQSETITTILEPNTILFAEDISPSDTLALDFGKVVGFVTQMGSKTSHAAIIAKSKGIPAVVGCSASRSVEDQSVIVVDGLTGIVEINPNGERLDEYKKKKGAYLKRSVFLKSLKDKKALTSDGSRIQLLANIGSPEELETVFDHGGEGVGLFRSELLFMNRNTFPSEDEQFLIYRQAALKSRGNPVTIRTLDIGGDKHLEYFDLPKEQNPFLGYRAIRISLDRKDIFADQLRAILRASAFGKLKIMFPMISNVQEIRAAKAVVDAVKEGLRTRGIAFQDEIEIGIMMEVPAAAMTADFLAGEVDFFSIGTNDLCQYTLAVDRMSEKIKHMYDPFNPGVLRLIHRVIDEGHKKGIDVALCGEMASDPMATVLLLGMGLREFSMSAGAIPDIKHEIMKHSMAEAKTVFMKVMSMDSSDDIKKYLEGLSK